MTKYVSGHSDIIGGAAIVRDGAPDLVERLGFLQNATGGVLDPFSSFLALRGLKTLPLRMARHAANAQVLAEFLESHAKVARVSYPGLRSHPQHNLAARQMSSGGGMVSFFVKGSPERRSGRSNNSAISRLPNRSAASRASSDTRGR